MGWDGGGVKQASSAVHLLVGPSIVATNLDAEVTERGLDFADAERVFAGRNFTLRDERYNYGESRFVTAGYLGERFVVVVWTSRGARGGSSP
jgi:hypothetical protein